MTKADGVRLGGVTRLLHRDAARTSPAEPPTAAAMNGGHIVPSLAAKAANRAPHTNAISATVSLCAGARNPQTTTMPNAVTAA
jgi:hypothetical protein